MKAKRKKAGSCSRCGAVSFSPIRRKRPVRIGRGCRQCGQKEHQPLHLLSTAAGDKEGRRHLFSGSLPAAVKEFRRLNPKAKIVARTQAPDGKFKLAAAVRPAGKKGDATLISVEKAKAAAARSSSASAVSPHALTGFAPVTGFLFINFPERRFASDAVTGLPIGFTNENQAMPPDEYQVTLDGPANFHDNPTEATVTLNATRSITLFLDA